MLRIVHIFMRPHASEFTVSGRNEPMTDRPSITIVSGTPGTGKTTISERLAELWQGEGPKVAHLDSDTFFSFPTKLIPPETPEAQEQNEVVSRAIAGTALEFSNGGYSVILDGVVGPWMLPHYLKCFQDLVQPGTPGSLAYVVLRASLEETLSRATNRPDAEKFSPEGVRVMYRQFADLKVFEPHVYETDGITPEQTATNIAAALASGAYRISMAS